MYRRPTLEQLESRQLLSTVGGPTEADLVATTRLKDASILAAQMKAFEATMNHVAPKPEYSLKPVCHVIPKPVYHVAPKPVYHVAPKPVCHVIPKPVYHVAPKPVYHVAPKPVCSSKRVCHTPTPAPKPVCHTPTPAPKPTPTSTPTPTPVPTPTPDAIPVPVPAPTATILLYHRYASLTAAGLTVSSPLPAKGTDVMSETETLNKPLTINLPGISSTLATGTVVTFLYGPVEASNGLISSLESQY
jgi:hypothetical protein